MQYVPEFGPWFMTYRLGHRGYGAMLVTGGHDVVLSGGLLDHGIVIGWRSRKERFPIRRLVVGRER